MKKIAVMLMAAALSGLVTCGNLYAEETPATEEVQAQADPEQTEAAVETEEEFSVPKTRPEYRALDYVKIDDDEYKKIQLSV